MANANVVELTTANWEQEVAKSDKPVLVDFWAVWCGPCRMLSPTIDKIADQYAGKIKVAKLNIDDNQQLAVKYGINTIPQVLLFKHHLRRDVQTLRAQRRGQATEVLERLLRHLLLNRVNLAQHRLHLGVEAGRTRRKRHRRHRLDDAQQRQARAHHAAELDSV